MVPSFKTQFDADVGDLERDTESAADGFHAQQTRF